MVNNGNDNNGYKNSNSNNDNCTSDNIGYKIVMSTTTIIIITAAGMVRTIPKILQW